MRKEATITIVKDALFADIDAQTFKRVDGVLSAESEQMKNAISTDSEESLDRHILYRLMETRDAAIRQRLTFCLIPSDEALTANNLLDERGLYFKYMLTVPENCDKQRLQSIARKIHNYLVQGTLYDWYATQNMKGNVGSAELEEMESSIVSMLRSSYVKRPLQPFGPRN